MNSSDERDEGMLADKHVNILDVWRYLIRGKRGRKTWNEKRGRGMKAGVDDRRRGNMP